MNNSFLKKGHALLIMVLAFVMLVSGSNLLAIELTGQKQTLGNADLHVLVSNEELRNQGKIAITVAPKKDVKITNLKFNASTPTGLTLKSGAPVQLANLTGPQDINLLYEIKVAATTTTTAATTTTKKADPLPRTGEDGSTLFFPIALLVGGAALLMFLLLRQAKKSKLGVFAILLISALLIGVANLPVAQISAAGTQASYSFDGTFRVNDKQYTFTGTFEYTRETIEAPTTTPTTAAPTTTTTTAKPTETTATTAKPTESSTTTTATTAKPTETSTTPTTAEPTTTPTTTEPTTTPTTAQPTTAPTTAEPTTTPTTAEPTTSPTNAPTPTPVVEVKEETKTEAIPFGKETVEDPTIDKGTSKITQVGVPGEKKIVETVTYTDGKETGRVFKSETVTKDAIPEITAVGTKPVVTTKDETKTEEIPFETKTTENPDLDEGVENIITVGKKGVRTIVEKVTFTDGVETAREETSNEVTTPPVDEVKEVGTRKPYTVTFYDAAEAVIKTVEVKHGGTIDAADVPTVPNKIGYSGKWDTDTTAAVTSNLDIKPDYTLKSNAFVIKDANGIDRVVVGNVNTNLSNAFLTKLNAERQKLGLGALQSVDSWTAGANIRAKEASVFFSHARPETPTNEYSFKTAFSSPQPSAENIAVGNSTADAVYQQWFNSTKGHKEIMLDGAYTKTAIACFVVEETTSAETNYTYYWVQVFG